MASLDTPLEALAFEFGVFAVVNNLWTWIAVVTAAVSFWRIIGVTPIGNGSVLLAELIEPEITGPKSITGPVEESVAPVKEAFIKTETVTDVWEPLMCNDGVTKGKKLTMYYVVEQCDDGELTDVNGGECDNGELTGVNYGLGDCGEWWEKWEKVLKLRSGDDSWYRYVDLTVINGNVVRLWEDNGICNGGR